MKVKLPLLIQDPYVTRDKEIGLTENYVFECEALFLMGPSQSIHLYGLSGTRGHVGCRWR